MSSQNQWQLNPLHVHQAMDKLVAVDDDLPAPQYLNIWPNMD